MGKLDELNRVAPAPPKKDPEIEANEKEMGGRIVQDMDKANNDPATPDSGIWYSYNYEDKANNDPAYKGRWKESYRMGFADPKYFEQLGFMDWRVRPKISASEAVKAWLKGLTIAECYSTVIAIHYDTIRAAIGDEKFDEKFGGADGLLPQDKLMRISTPNSNGAQPLDEFMKATDANAKGDSGTVGDRKNVKEGEWYYFYNHPKYLLKHPGGAWQGENAIYMGKNDAGEQLWAGLGTRSEATGLSSITEEDMFLEMIADYNRDRDDNDKRALDGIRAGHGGTTPPEYLLPSEGGTVFKDAVTREDILNDPPYKIGDTTRKGGFLLQAGKTLDPDKVKALRDK
jgi:hypothetical protein